MSSITISMVRIVALEVVLVLFLLYFLINVFFARKKINALPPLPPGPKGLPFIGNVNDLPPPGQDYQHWLKHKDRYGPLSSVTVLGQTIVIIHDKDTAYELMEKRGNIFSGRPTAKFACEMYVSDLHQFLVARGLRYGYRIGWKHVLGCLPYDNTFKRYRRYFHQHLGSQAAVSKMYTLQEAVVGRFLWRINRDGGENLVKHLRT